MTPTPDKPECVACAGTRKVQLVDLGGVLAPCPLCAHLPDHSGDAPDKPDDAKAQAGAEVDARVAREVMGWTAPRIGGTPPPFPIPNAWDYAKPPPEVEAWRSDYHWRDAQGACWARPHEFSRDIGKAWQVVEKLNEDSWMVDIHIAWGQEARRRVWCELYNIEICDPSVEVTADTAPLAICLAALRARSGAGEGTR